MYIGIGSYPMLSLYNGSTIKMNMQVSVSITKHNVRSAGKFTILDMSTNTSKHLQPLFMPFFSMHQAANIHPFPLP